METISVIRVFPPDGPHQKFEGEVLESQPGFLRWRGADGNHATTCPYLVTPRAFSDELVNLVLLGITKPDQKIPIIKELRADFQLGLAEAKKMSETTGAQIKDRFPRAVAEAFVEKYRAMGLDMKIPGPPPGPEEVPI